MILIENVEISGIMAAIRGARNPMNSWDKSDSKTLCDGIIKVGNNDINLLRKLSCAGTDHGKFLRMINVTCDITAPLYWWKQFDTYRIGVEKNSCSTMHKIHAKEFSMDDFSTEHMEGTALEAMEQIVVILNAYRDEYNETKDKRAWYTMVQLLPNCYNQKRTVMMSYAAIKNMYHARKSHKLDEWKDFCRAVERWPLASSIITCEQGS